MRLILLLVVTLTLVGCASSAYAPSPSPKVQELSQASLSQPAAKPEKPTSPLLPSAFFANGAERFTAWRCTPAQDLIAAFTTEGVRLWSGQGYYRLDRAVVASGARYVRGDLSFWNKGNEALVESANGRLECKRDVVRETITRATRPETILFAKGNEPGWMLILERDTSHLKLIADYGKQSVRLPYRVEGVTNGQQASMRLSSLDADQALQAHLQAKACFDSMSGMPYPVQVTIQWQGRTLHGCAQGIEAL